MFKNKVCNTVLDKVEFNKYSRVDNCTRSGLLRGIQPVFGVIMHTHQHTH